MCIRILLAFMVWVGMAMPVSAQQKDSHSEDSLAIAREAESPDFIHVYLLAISEGDEFYSVFGHTAIRMKAESKNLDYCFTFEMNLRDNSDWKIFLREAKAGFVYVPTPKFLADYERQGRGIEQYELNLLPSQKQNLWRILDEEVVKGDVWTYDVNINCLTMAMYAIEKSIAPEKIRYGYLNPLMKGDYDDWLDYVTRKSPWMNLVLKLERFDETTLSTTDRFSLDFLKESLPRAIVQGTDSVRPLVKGTPVVLMNATHVVEPYWLSPKVVLGIMVLIVIVLLIVLIKKKKK